ncbi:MAG TPA: branched-chain amino acid ABC transporter permease [Thermodesulfobacteriota bacterium]|nr:branched-chain amino acid ABC transporter permease [Thermodesulfobacteriota bacterium]
MDGILLQVIVSGLLLGGVYALLSVGLNLIFGVVRVINFAHGDLMMLGMYLTFYLFGLYKIDPYLSAILLVAPALFLVGMAVQRLLIKPLQKASALMLIFSTFGLSIALQNLALMGFRADYRTILTPLSTATFNLAGISISIPRLIAFVLALVLLIALFLLLRYTLVGKALRALAENRVVTQLMGVRVQRLNLLAFGLGSAITGVAGALILPFSYVFPTIGGSYTLVAFVVVVLGGLGNMAGAFLGGLTIGLVESLSGTYIAPALKEAIYFVIFILVLLVRPQGLFGLGKGTEEVGLK